MSERPFPSVHPRPLEPATYLHIVLPGACHAGAYTVPQEGDMNKIAPAILASALSATPLAAADFGGVASQPPVPPVVAEEGAPVAPPPPRCRAAGCERLSHGSLDRASRGDNRTWRRVSDPRSSR